MFLHPALNNMGSIFREREDKADKAFPHFFEGCSLKRKRLQYDAMAREQSLGRVHEVFFPDFVESRKGQGCKSDQSIFVLGMPRTFENQLKYAGEKRGRVSGYLP